MLPDFLRIDRSRYRLPFLSGLLLIACQPPVSQFYLAYIALVPLFFSLEAGNGRRNFLSGFAAGIVSFSGLVYWVVVAMNTFGGISMPLAVATLALLVLYLALFTGCFTWVVGLLADRLRVPLILSAPAAWALLEYLRGVLLTGFPWSLLAHSQYNFLPIVQVVSVTGTYFLSFLIVAVNVIVYRIVAERRFPIASGTAVVVLSCGCLAFGFHRLAEPVKGTMSASIVQGNIHQDVKFDQAYRDSIVRTYAGLTLADSRPSDLVVWPETAMPFVFLKDGAADLIRSLPDTLGNELLFGTISMDSRGRYYNTAYAIGKKGRIFNPYSKNHLVPFGEYTPLSAYFPFLENISVATGDFFAGPSHDPIRTDTARIGVLICFEGIFPSIAADSVRRGAEVLVNMTNDAWFGRSSAPYQHFASYVFRAVETDRWVLRAANTGISAIIDPRGRTTARTGLFRTAVLRGEFGLREDRTVYVRYGDYFLVVALALLSVPVVVQVLRMGW